MVIELLFSAVLCLVSVWVLLMVYFFALYGFPWQWGKDQDHEHD
jgi:hypothetical protein